MFKVFGRLKRVVEATAKSLSQMRTLGPHLQCATCGADLVWVPSMRRLFAPIAKCPDRAYEWHHVAVQKARIESGGATLTALFDAGRVPSKPLREARRAAAIAGIEAPTNRSRKRGDATESKGPGRTRSRGIKAKASGQHGPGQGSKGGQASGDGISGCGCCPETRWVPCLSESERSDADHN